jgi:hypothetical protein
MSDKTIHELADEAEAAMIAYLRTVVDDSVFVPDMDPRWPRLLAAARVWQASLIPKTSTSVFGPTRLLIEAIEAFEKKPCDHPRAQRVFHSSEYIETGVARESCGKCGAVLTQEPPKP